MLWPKTALLILALFTLPVIGFAAVPAFPGAEGFGTTTIGGRGGKVYVVANLNDSGAGSFRECAEAAGPRTCVFAIGGTILTKSAILINNPFITIAGQTAPGGGITLKNDPAVSVDDSLQIHTNDVIVRYIRLRPDPTTRTTTNLDALEIGDKVKDLHSIVIDHVSLSWAPDENVIAWYTAHDITFSWNIISEALMHSTHTEGGTVQTKHSMGILLGEKNGGNYSVHHNLLAHNNRRNPEIKTTKVTDFVNNLIYNPGSANLSIGTIGDAEGTKTLFNYIGNYVKLGPSSSANSYEIIFYPVTGFGAAIYVQDNIGPHRSDQSVAQDAVVNPPDRKYLINAPNPAAPITTTSAAQMYDAVLAEAGASRMLNADGFPVMRRDTVDTRVINDVKNGTGKIINNPSEVGGWPPLAAGTPYPDADRDGMSDTWEQNRFGNLTQGNAADSSSDFDHDGYTDLEEFLNSTDPQISGGGQTQCVKKPHGDADCNDVVTIGDYIIWRQEYLKIYTTERADFNNDKNVTIGDYIIWRTNYLASH